MSEEQLPRRVKRVLRRGRVDVYVTRTWGLKREEGPEAVVRRLEGSRYETWWRGVKWRRWHLGFLLVRVRTVIPKPPPPPTPAPPPPPPPWIIEPGVTVEFYDPADNAWKEDGETAYHPHMPISEETYDNWCRGFRPEALRWGFGLRFTHEDGRVWKTK